MYGENTPIKAHKRDVDKLKNELTDHIREVSLQMNETMKILKDRIIQIEDKIDIVLTNIGKDFAELSRKVDKLEDVLHV